MRNPASVAAVLVPRRKWAPAWIAWRTGCRYVGWALLPPEVERIQSDLLAVRRLRAGLARHGVEPSAPLTRPEERETPAVEPDVAFVAKKRKEP